MSKIEQKSPSDQSQKLRPRYLDGDEVAQIVNLLRRFGEQTQSRSIYDQIEKLISRLMA